MAVAVDASSPARWSGNIAHSAGLASASFTAPANALLVVCANWDGSGATEGPATISDSGGLTWTAQVRRDIAETTTGGGSGIFTARTTSAVARTVTLTNGGSINTTRYSAKCYVLTGVDVDGTPVDTVGVNNEGGSATNNLTTTSITAGANGLLICSDTDWSQLGVFTSSDLTIDTADYAAQISVCSGYKSVSSGASVNGNLNAGGTAAAQHKWTQVIVREIATVSTPVEGWQTYFPWTGAERFLVTPY